MSTELKEQSEAIEVVSSKSVTIYDQVKALVVKDQESYNLATDLYKAALDVEKAVCAAHDPVCDHWHSLHKSATAARKQDLDKVVEAKKLAKSKAAVWQDEQERIRRQEEERLQAEARRIADEQARVAREAAEAERKRIEAEEEAERLKLAEEAERAGASIDEVTAILETPLYEPEPVPEVIPVPVVLPTVAPTFQKSSGFSVRYNYGAIFNDIMPLIKAAAANPFMAQYLSFNEQAINAQARASKDAFNMPGCTLRKERV